MYSCDNWVVMMSPSGDHYRLLTGTSGGYLTGSSWRLNSGIVSFEEFDANYYIVKGHSGSSYKVHKDGYQVRLNCANVFNQLEKAGWTLVPEETDWLNFDWKIK